MSTPQTTKTYLRPNQIREMESEKATLLKQLESPYIENKGQVRKQLGMLTHNLESQTPPDLDGEKRDKIAKEAAQLKEEILQGMPSAEEMRKNPPGAVGKHMAWEKRNKTKILRWKNCQLMLEKGSDDPDIANFERFRPTVSTLPMAGAQIPGKFHSIPSEEFKENYDRVFRQEKEIENLKEELELLRTAVAAQEQAKQKKSGGEWTPERRERMRNMMKKRHAEKMAAERASESPGGMT
jgi:hypothetical protein